MRIVSICDSKDVCTGLRLVGIEGSVTKTSEEFLLAFENAVSYAGIVVVSKELAKQHAAQMDEVRINRTTPLIVEL